LFSWLPVIGDPLCFAAGWLRINALQATLFIAAGKAARYAVVLFFTT
jgi:membrane protein YqaA with SNARE-associated domain